MIGLTPIGWLTLVPKNFIFVYIECKMKKSNILIGLHQNRYIIFSKTFNILPSVWAWIWCNFTTKPCCIENTIRIRLIANLFVIYDLLNCYSSTRRSYSKYYRNDHLWVDTYGETDLYKTPQTGTCLNNSLNIIFNRNKVHTHTFLMS